MDYQSRIEALFERHRSVQTAGFSSDAYKPGLMSMMIFESRLGHPHAQYPTVHVAGTNGKGTVCSMIASVLASKGYKTGLYTSPHLLGFPERMKIITRDGWRMIPQEDVCAFLDTCGDLGSLSFFEITTGMAFWWFARQNVDVAVIETGLGGRLDSTNIITPLVSVVTSIGLDHCDLLGPTREAIAAEKAGIFKYGVPAVVWGRDGETGPVFERAAAAAGAPLVFAEDRGNAATALAALRILLPGQDLQIPDYQHMTGLRARWEVIRENPHTIVDIGHNPPALALNFARLKAYNRPLLIVYGAMADKDVDSIAELMPKDARYFLVAPKTPRAMSTDNLALKLKTLDHSCYGSVADGVSAAMQEASGLEEPIVYIGGSTYVASEAISFLEKL